jgi:pimeloyl-ACP methyl ester carboxylesterase
LVHGAWHGAWCWKRLIPALAERGRTAIAIDLPGCGDDTTPLREVTLDACADRLVDALGLLDEPGILLGHSMGGVSISVAAERAPERIAKLVYLCAYIPRNGDSLMGLSGQGDPAEVVRDMVFSDDGLSVTPPRGAIKSGFYADCCDEDVAFAKARLRPQAIQPAAATINLSPARFGRVPKAYIECLQDNAIPIGQQRSMAETAQPIEVHSMNTSHSPFFSAPEALADILVRL